jgi:hypothetical protein
MGYMAIFRKLTGLLKPSNLASYNSYLRQKVSQLQILTNQTFHHGIGGSSLPAAVSTSRVGPDCRATMSSEVLGAPSGPTEKREYVLPSGEGI